MKKFESSTFRRQFPLLSHCVNNMPLVYFDNAATTQKPDCVIEKNQQYYQQVNANVHRASHALSAKATYDFEAARRNVKTFIHAKTEKEIIWTKGTTEGINLIAHSWGMINLKPNDEIVLSHSEHHANIVPWQVVAEKTGAIIKVLPLDEEGRIDESQLAKNITSTVKIVCVTHVSNVLGKVNPVDKIISQAKKVGALTLIDGAQAIAHLPINVQLLNCDFYLFSAHKMYGPTGVGVLYGRLELLEIMPPYQTGGEMINKVSFQGTTYNDLPFKFEAGTPNIAGIIAFSEAIDFIQQFKHADIAVYEHALVKYAMEQLTQINSVRFVSKGTPDIPVISFTIEGHHNHDIASELDSAGIALRSGHHCAMPLMEYFGINGCIRMSFAPYNTFEEIDFFIAKLADILHKDVPDIPASIPETYHHASDVIIDTFQSLKGWDSRHREIMMLGKKSTRLPTEERNENNLIDGCESLAWLNFTKNECNQYHFTTDSDAKIIRGLLVIVLAAFNDKTAEQIHAFNIDEYFCKLGLLQHLSPSRGNGVKAIVEKIKVIAQ